MTLGGCPATVCSLAWWGGTLGLHSAARPAVGLWNCRLPVQAGAKPCLREKIVAAILEGFSEFPTGQLFSVNERFVTLSRTLLAFSH